MADKKISGLAALTTPVDADLVPVVDVSDTSMAASGTNVKVTWANVKATLKTYFDTLYNLYVHPNHSGDVTSVADGATTIAADAVTYAKIQNVVADNVILGNNSGAGGIVDELTATEVRTILNVENGADVTDTANVTAAGALMDSEVDADIKTLVLPASTTISTFGASIIDDADEATFKATVNLEIGTDVQAYNADLTSLATNWVQASAAGASSLDFHEDTDNGVHKITVKAAASVASDKTLTLPDETGTVLTSASGQPLDATLTALAAHNTNGVLTQTAADTFAGRTITGTSNEVTVTNGDGVSGNPTLSLPATIDLGGKTSFEVPNSAAPTIDADGEIAVDTTVTDFSHGVLKYFGGEEMGVVAMPIAQFTSPTDTYVVKYNATADEFQLAADAGVGTSGVLIPLNQGIVYYHESMGYITRDSDEIDADLADMILHGTHSIRVLQNPMKASTNWDSSSQFYNIIQRAKLKGLFVLAGANFVDGVADINYDTGTASSGSSTTLVDSSKSWTTDEWVGFQVYITAGTGSGQAGMITANSATTLTITAEDGFATFSPSPSSDSVYKITFEKIAENPWTMANGYADRVVLLAEQAYLAGADAFDVANELSTHRRTADTYTNDTNMPGHLRDLADSVAAGTDFAITDIGVAVEFHKVGSWASNGGVGSMGHLGFNFYGNDATFFGDTADAVNNFGADKVWATEWSAEGTFDSLAVSEAEYTRVLRERQGRLRSLGIKPFAFCYRETTDGGFGYKKSIATGGERDAWNDSYPVSSISDHSDVLLYNALNKQVIAWNSTTKRYEPVSIFEGGVVINEAGADVDLRVESDTNANGLFLDASTSRVGINTGSPLSDLDIVGTFRFRDAETPTKSFRYRFGGATDAEGAGADIYYSVWQNGDFTGNQYTHFILSSSGQTIAFRSKPLFNNEAGDIDFQVKGDTDDNMIYGDASTDRVGIGLNNPSEKLEVSGNIKATDVLVTDEAYGSGWDTSLEVPTKNAVYDKIETLGGGLTTAQAIAFAVAL